MLGKRNSGPNNTTVNNYTISEGSSNSGNGSVGSKIIQIDEILGCSNLKKERRESYDDYEINVVDLSDDEHNDDEIFKPQFPPVPESEVPESFQDKSILHRHTVDTVGNHELLPSSVNNCYYGKDNNTLSESIVTDRKVESTTQTDKYKKSIINNKDQDKSTQLDSPLLSVCSIVPHKQVILKRSPSLNDGMMKNSEGVRISEHSTLPNLISGHRTLSIASGLSSIPLHCNLFDNQSIINSHPLLLPYFGNSHKSPNNVHTYCPTFELDRHNFRQLPTSDSPSPFSTPIRRPPVIKTVDGQQHETYLDVDEHFRKSLSQKRDESANADVDAHFEKALGETWRRLKDLNSIDK